MKSRSDSAASRFIAAQWFTLQSWQVNQAKRSCGTVAPAAGAVLPVPTALKSLPATKR